MCEEEGVNKEPVKTGGGPKQRRGGTVNWEGGTGKGNLESVAGEL